jgi:hypothetical protein
MTTTPLIRITCFETETESEVPFPRLVVEEIQTAILEISREKAEDLKSSQSRVLNSEPLVELILALGTAQVFTALVQIVIRYLDKNKKRGFVFEYGDTKISINGHNPKEAMELFDKLFSAAEKRRLLDAGLHGEHKPYFPND